MSVRRIVRYPDPILRQVATPVQIVDDSIRQLVADLTDTMRKHHAWGLAAPQIGVPLRVCVIQPRSTPRSPVARLVLINPVLSGFTGKHRAMEACLSLPGRQVMVRRARRCFVDALNLDGTNVGAPCWVQDWEARVVQHEVDHLDGILIIDQGSKVRQRPREVRM
jgi:peptide deformylase